MLQNRDNQRYADGNVVDATPAEAVVVYDPEIFPTVVGSTSNEVIFYDQDGKIVGGTYAGVSSVTPAPAEV